MEDPAPCVLLAHTFQHQDLRDHVDEIRFTEPVLVTAFEILDFRKSSSSAAISLLGETLPSTFTLEMYFHVRGEPRFRPVCSAFVYSASKPSPLDIQVCVTDHMVIRGTYSAITLVIFGNPVKDLNWIPFADAHEYNEYSGIFNLRPQQVKTDELKKLVTRLLSLATPKSHTAIAMAALSYQKQKGAKELLQIISEAAEENGEIEVQEEKHALNLALRWISDGLELRQTSSQVDTLITGLAAVQLLCMDIRSCSDFISARGILLLVDILRDYSKESTVYTALALQTLELCSRYAFGCDAILAWEDKNEKTKLGYSTLLSTLLQAQRPFIAHLSVEVLHRLRVYELASIFQATVDSLLMDAPSDKKEIKKVLLEALYSLQRLTNVLLLKDDVTSSLNVNRFMNMEFEDENHLLDDLSDEYISTLLQERRVIPAVVALLSSPHFRYEQNMHMYVNLTGTAQKLILSLLSSPSGNMLLATESEAVSAMINAFNNSNQESINMRQLAVMVNQELVFQPQEITQLLAASLTVLNTFGRLLASTSSEETLWCLRRLAKLSRAQTVSTILQKPEVLCMVVKILEDCAASDFLETNEKLLASFHYSTQILYGLLTDTVLSTWTHWIPHAAKMREIFQNLKDSGIFEILEDSEHILQLQSIVDVAIVYQSEGALGLLKFIAGGYSNEDQLDACKLLEKILAYSTGYSMVLQLTCCMQILASVCSSSIAASLIGEGAVGIITVLLECCASVLQEDMLDQDYDIDMNKYTLRLLIPTLLLLSTLCERIQREGIQYRNSKLVALLLRLHRILSGKSGAYATCPPYTWDIGGVETAAVLRCLASVLAFWPVYNWDYSFAQSRIFPSSLPVDSIETCSSLILLADFLPSESIYEDKREIYRNFSLESILGTNVIPQVNWHTHSPFKENILETFVPHLGEIVLRLSSTTCTVLINLLKIVIVRLSCASADHTGTVLRPLITYICEEGFAKPTAGDSLREEYCIKFVTELALHPASKAVLLREEIVKMLCEKISDISPFKEDDENIPASFHWLLKFLTKICQCMFPLSFEDCSRIASLLNSLLKVLPLGDEFEVLIQLFETFSTHRLGRAAFITMFNEAEENNKDSVKPLLILTKRLCTALNEDRNAIGGCCSSLLQLTHGFSYAMLKLSAGGKSFIGLGALKFLFGNEQNTEDSAVLELINVISQRLDEGSFSEGDQHKANQTKQALEALTRLLQRSIQQDELLEKVQIVAKEEFKKSNSDPLMRLVPEVNLQNPEISYEYNLTENFMWEYSAELPKRTLRNPKRKAEAYTNVRKRKKTSRAQSAHEREYPKPDEFMLRQQKNKTREDLTDEDEPRTGSNGLTSTKEAEHDKDTMVYPIPSQAFAIPGITMTDPNHLQQMSQMVQLQTQHSQLYQQMYQSTSSLTSFQQSIQQIYQPPPPPAPAPQESLQHILSSSESIQELLKDQTRLTRLLEEHPKLLSLLQEKLQL